MGRITPDPDKSLERLHQLVRDALAAEAMQQFFLAQGATSGGMPPAEFGKLIRDEVAHWHMVASRAGLSPQ